MEEAVLKEIQSKSKIVSDVAGRQALVIEERRALAIGKAFGIGLSEVFLQALRLGVCPKRYLRNREILTLKEQLRLAESQVAVVGAGGLGGSVLSLLARMGVGHLVVIDHDVLDETNLNRQVFCHSKNLGKPKASEARSQMQRINPGVEVSAHQTRLDPSNGKELLAGCNVVVDALDNVASRLVLEEAAQVLAIPLVHGALAGFEGQVMSLLPGDKGFARIYGKARDGAQDPGRPEALLGVPAITPTLVATFQAMEVIKILLDRGNLFRNTMVYLDLERGEINRFRFE